jgi:GntP family gluconate:H+ symporter
MNAALLPLVAALIAIILLVILVTFCRVHPFLSLLIVSISLGLACQLPPADVMKQFEKGFGETVSFVGIVIGLGTMLGGLLVFSGGAERLANALVSIGGKAWIPWTIFFAALLVGLPLFFEVGFVLLVPLALVIAHKTDSSALLNALARQSETGSPGHERKSEPSLLAVIVAVLLPPVLMMSRSLISAVLPEGNALRSIAEFLGDPVMALLVALFYAIFVLGLAQGADMGRVLEILNACLAPVAAIILIVGAGGGFKQMLIATGSGSLILSHVNDAGFWLVKEYFGLTLPETFKSWTVMETILSVLGLVFSLLLGLVVH